MVPPEVAPRWREFELGLCESDGDFVEGGAVDIGREVPMFRWDCCGGVLL